MAERGPARRAAAAAADRLRDAGRPSLVALVILDGSAATAAGWPCSPRRGDDRGQLRADRRRAAHAGPAARLRRWRWRRRRLIRLLGRLLGPIATLLILIGNAITPGRGYRDGPFTTEVELRELVDMAEERGVVEPGERNMIHSVFELGDTIAREVMVPRTDVVWIERGKTVRQALALCLRSGFSRHPGDRRQRRRRRRRRLPQGPRPPRRRTSATAAAAQVEELHARRRPSCRSPSRSTSCCGRCRPRAPTWRSSSTSTAASPAW